jgi:hypothetical protein
MQVEHHIAVGKIDDRDGLAQRYGEIMSLEPLNRELEKGSGEEWPRFTPANGE